MRLLLEQDVFLFLVGKRIFLFNKKFYFQLEAFQNVVRHEQEQPQTEWQRQAFLLNVTLTVEVAPTDYTAASGPDC